MNAILQERAILALLAQLQGVSATGTLLVQSTAATGTLPKHSYAVPIEGGALLEDGLLRVEANPATEDGSWAITAAGVEVSVSAVQGGLRGNLATAGTECRWDPPVDGIEAASEVSVSLSGGTQLETFGALRQIKLYRELSRDAAQDLFRAQVMDLPAAVLAWVSASPVSGSVSASYGATEDRVGRGRRLFKNEWALFLISSRSSSAEDRIREGHALRDDVLEVLTDATAARGQPLSAPQGIEILDARSYETTPTSYVDLVRFAASYTLVRRPSNETFSTWAKTRHCNTLTDAGLKPATLNIPDQTFAMP